MKTEEITDKQLYDFRTNFKPDGSPVMACDCIVRLSADGQARLHYRATGWISRKMKLKEVQQIVHDSFAYQTFPAGIESAQIKKYESDGGMMETALLIDGKREGQCLRTWTDGSTHRMTYKNGRLSGPARLEYPSGQIVEFADYPKNGVVTYAGK